MPAASTEVLAIGRVGVDLYPMQSGRGLAEVSTFEKFLGGSAGNVAVAAARYGHRSALISRTGDDPFGHLLEHTMQDAGISTEGMRFSQEYHTTLAFVQLDEKGDRSFSFYRRGCADVMLSYADVDAACRATIQITGRASPGADAATYPPYYERYRALYPALAGEFKAIAAVVGA